MSQLELLKWTPPQILGDRSGITYEPKRDRKRLNKQAIAVFQFMSDHEWHSLRDISEATGAPEASASARLRDFRSEKFGGFNVERRHLSKGLWQYRMLGQGA